MSPERALLHALFHLEHHGEHQDPDRTISVDRKADRAPCLVVEPARLASVLALRSAAGRVELERVGAANAITFTGEGPAAGGAVWMAELALAPGAPPRPAAITLRTGPSALAFLLAGVTLPRDLIASGELDGDLGALSTLNQVVECRTTWFAQPIPMLALWAWGEDEAVREAGS